MALGGCQRRQPQVAPPEAPAVPVSHPISREVTDYVDFTGRLQAINSVNVVPRATGYLVLPPSGKQFKEGSEVTKGEQLFQIDPRPYQAQYDQAVGQVNLYKAQLKLAQATQARDEQLARSTPGAVSAQQLDQDRAATAEAEAQVIASQASLETYKLNLEFCKVTSPIDGQVSRYYLTLGNLVSQDQTLLTTVVSLDPVYAYFDVDEPTVLRVRRAINEGRIKPYGPGRIPVLMGLQGEDGFPRKGYIDFINNQVNPTTGSILVRGVFDNPLPPGGRRLLIPGMFVRIRLPIGQPQRHLLVIDSAIQSDQDKKYVYLLKDGKIAYQGIKTGALQNDGLRVLTEGLAEKDLVVVNALQQVHTGMEARPDVISMPELSGPTAKLGPGALPAGSLPGNPATNGSAPPQAPAKGSAASEMPAKQSAAGSAAAGGTQPPPAGSQGASQK